ncbi:MAG: hypothetical protein ACR2FG_12945 [Marmoricola sp.]
MPGYRVPSRLFTDPGDVVAKLTVERDGGIHVVDDVGTLTVAI